MSQSKHSTSHATTPEISRKEFIACEMLYDPPGMDAVCPLRIIMATYLAEPTKLIKLNELKHLRNIRVVSF